MDRRYNQRIAGDLPVVLTLLDSEEEALGTLLDISESGVGVLLRTEAHPGELVKLEILGIIFYGYVAHSKSEGTGFRTGISVEPALLDSSNILELVNSFLIGHVG
jgi:PilZ domain